MRLWLVTDLIGVGRQILWMEFWRRIKSYVIQWSWGLTKEVAGLKKRALRNGVGITGEGRFGSARSKNTWAPPHFCRTVRQWMESSLTSFTSLPAIRHRDWYGQGRPRPSARATHFPETGICSWLCLRAGVMQMQKLNFSCRKPRATEGCSL